MLVAGLVLTGLAAAVHVLVWYLESLAWTGPRARAVFGTSPAEAEATRELAFNQGFYNLFLAVLVVLGTVLVATGSDVVGLTLVLAGAGCMAAAGLVLLVSSPDKASAAARQFVPPLLGIVLLVLARLG
ncbi:DUF1304 domain-containing protein [Kineococcus gynurae]|uniref:DUF1304 domain-containing protein n=1 Tax=Kineococcus gynurae TaxID=452979 RepID=A0ABV5LP66_9ACTN